MPLSSVSTHQPWSGPAGVRRRGFADARKVARASLQALTAARERRIERAAASRPCARTRRCRRGLRARLQVVNNAHDGAGDQCAACWGGPLHPARGGVGHCVPQRRCHRTQHSTKALYCHCVAHAHLRIQQWPSMPRRPLKPWRAARNGAQGWADGSRAATQYACSEC